MVAGGVTNNWGMVLCCFLNRILHWGTRYVLVHKAFFLKVLSSLSPRLAGLPLRDRQPRYFPQQFLYFIGFPSGFLAPHGHGSFLPALGCPPVLYVLRLTDLPCMTLSICSSLVFIALGSSAFTTCCSCGRTRILNKVLTVVFWMFFWSSPKNL